MQEATTESRVVGEEKKGEGRVGLFVWFLSENDLNRFLDFGGKKIDDVKGIRERELHRNHGLRLDYTST